MRNKLYQYLMLLLFAIIVVAIHLIINVYTTDSGAAELDVNDSEIAEADNLEYEYPTYNEIIDEGQWEFPSLYITSELNPFEVERLLWHDGTVTLSGEFEDVDVSLRGRGNSTWGVSKRPLRLRFHEPRTVLGSEYPHGDWILLANAFDHSMLRNYFALSLADSMGNTGFVPSSQFIHLYNNGEYAGVYQLTDERDIGIGRLELLIHPIPSVSEYLLELNFRSAEGMEVNGRMYDMRFPRGRGQTAAHVDYASHYLHSVYEAIRAKEWSAITELIDIPSFVDFYIVQELTMDFDVGGASVFMQIRGQGNERRLYMGPVWDFDLSLGLILSELYGHYSGYDTTPEGIWTGIRHYWFKNLMDIPEFRDEVLVRWNDVMEYEIPQAIEEVLRMATTYQDDFERNFLVRSIEKGPHLLLGDGQQFETYMEHVEFMVNFIIERKTWLNEYFNSEYF